MATREEMVSALRGAHEAGDTEAATRIAGMIRRADAPYSPDNTTRVERPDEDYGNEGRSRPETTRQTIERLYTEGAGPKLGKLVADLGIGVAHGGKNIVTGMDAAITRAAGLKYAQPQKTEALDKAYEEAGPIAGVGNVIPELALTAIPIVGAGSKIAAGAKYLLPKAAAKFAPAIGDIAANAGYEAAKAAATGEDVGSAALTGGAGATAGRVLTRALGGIKPLLRDDAQALINRGVYPTPGQAIGGVAGSIEDKLLSLPIVGDIGQAARRRSLSDYGRAEVVDSLQPFESILKSKNPAFKEAKQAIGSTGVSGTGADAVEAAEKKISAAYSHALDGMDMGAKHIDDAIKGTGEAIDNIPLLDERQAAQLHHYINLRVAPNLIDGSLSGEAAKRLDAEMGHYARKYSRSVNPADHPLGDAFYTLQEKWRGQMAQAADDLGLGHKTALLNAANAAHRNLLPIVKASDRAMAQGGTFTPHQLQRAYGPTRVKQSPLNAAAQEVLPSRVPDSGTAGRLMLGAIAGGAGIGGAGLGATAATGLAAYALTSRTGLRLLYNGVAPTLKPEIRQWLQGLPPERVAQFFKEYGGRVPSVHQMASQIGRHLAEQQQQQQQPQEATQ